MSNKVEEIMKNYRKGIKDIDKKYEVKEVKEPKKIDTSEIDSKVKYEQDFIARLKSESEENNKDLIEKAQERLKIAEEEKSRIEQENQKAEEKYQRALVKREEKLAEVAKMKHSMVRHVIREADGEHEEVFREVTMAEKDEMDKDALKKAIQSVNDYTINTFENQISELNYAKCAQLIINKISKNRKYDEMKAITGNGVIKDLLRYSSSKSSENIKVKPRIIEHIIKCIEYEKSAKDYILYRGDKKNDFDISRVYRQQVCFSDGLFGGFPNDNGGGALRIAYEKESQGEPNALWKIELNRVKLLKWELPVFVPPAHPMVSFLSFGETHHPRTRLVYHSIQNSNPPKVANEFMGIAPGALKIEITPTTVIEYYTTTNPRILSVLPPNEFHETEQGIFDKEGATMLKTLVKNIQIA